MRSAQPRYPLIYLVLVLGLIWCPISGAEARAVTALPAPDPQGWQTIEEPSLAPDGRWLIYVLRSGPGGSADTVVQRSLVGREELRTTCGPEHRLSGLQLSPSGNSFAIAAASAAGEEFSRICIVRTGTERQSIVEGAIGFSYVPGEQDQLIVRRADSVRMMDADGRLLAEFGDATDATPEPHGRHIAVATPGGLWLYDTETQEKVAVDTRPGVAFGSLVWSKSGNSLAALRGGSTPAGEPDLLVFHKAGNHSGTLKIFTAAHLQGFPPGYVLAPLRRSFEARGWAWQSLVWRDDEKGVFVGARPRIATRQQPPSPAPIIYRSSDRLLPTEGPNGDEIGTGFVDIPRGRYIDLSGEEYLIVGAERRGAFALGLDWKPYDNAQHPQRSATASYQLGDIVRIELDTGRREKIRKALPFLMTNSPITSPDGRYFVYVAGGNVLAYDNHDRVERVISGDMQGGFAADAGRELLSPPWAPLGYSLSSRSHHWTTAGALLVNDAAGNLWSLRLDGSEARSLTRSTDMQRIEPMAPVFTREFSPLDMSRPLDLIVTDRNRAKMALARWVPSDQAVRRGPWIDGRVDCMAAARSGRIVCGRTAAGEGNDYFLAKGLTLGDRLTNLWKQRLGKKLSPGARYLSFTTARGDPLHATLFLPAGYEPGKKYPTIVSVYGAMSALIFQRIEPNQAAGMAMVYNLTQAGYAVLTTDVAHREDEAGPAALEAVTAAVRAADETGIIDKSRMGMRGHSFGGYQTMYVVSTSNLFRAAIEDGGMSDLAALYRTNFYGKFPLGYSMLRGALPAFSKPLHGNWQIYLDNSPAFHASTMDTPLLLIHGDKDQNTPFDQGMSFFSLLKMLGKPATLLHYRNVDHEPESDPAVWADILQREQQFFDHYLMGAPKSAWLIGPQ